MAPMSNNALIDAVKEITVAAVTGSGKQLCSKEGENVAAFMQAVYDKLVELNAKD